MVYFEGLCYVYIDKDVDLEMVEVIIVNFKMCCIGICGVVEIFFVNEIIVKDYLFKIVFGFLGVGCKLKGDLGVILIDGCIVLVIEVDWMIEYFDVIIFIWIVGIVDDVIEYIGIYGLYYIDIIVIDNFKMVEYFL